MTSRESASRTPRTSRVRRDAALRGSDWIYVQRGLWPLAVAGWIVSMAAVGRADEPCMAQHLAGPDPVAGQAFGMSVAVSGERLLIGAAGDDGVVFRSGAAHVYRRHRGTWWHEAKLMAADGATNALFGYSVAMDGNVAIVGAVSDGGRGAAYIFRFDGVGWYEEQKLTPPGGGLDRLIGNAVAIQGDVAVVGAPVLPYPPELPGSAHVYRFDGSVWVHEQELLADDAGIDEQFGFSVALDGERIVVGARWDDAAAPFSGSAYVFRYAGSGWTQEHKLVGHQAQQNDVFGTSVAIRGETIVVGAPQYWAAGGAVYVFRRTGNNWVQAQRIEPAGGQTDDNFGGAVAFDGGWLIVGAPQSFVGTGLAYVYSFDGSAWGGERIITAPAGVGPQGWFANTVAVGGRWAIIGARGADNDCGTTTCNLGAAYVLDLLGECGQPEQPAAGPVSPGGVGSLRP